MNKTDADARDECSDAASEQARANETNKGRSQGRDGGKETGEQKKDGREGRKRETALISVNTRQHKQSSCTCRAQSSCSVDFLDKSQMRCWPLGT